MPNPHPRQQELLLPVAPEESGESVIFPNEIESLPNEGILLLDLFRIAKLE